MKGNLLACSIVILCGLCGMVSCDRPKVSVEPQTMTLRATIEQPVAYSASPAMFGDSEYGVQQRTIIQDGTIPHQIVWQANDQIIIHFNTGVQGSMRIFDLTSGAGTGSAEFEYTGFGYTSDPDVTMQEELPEEYDSILAGYPAMFVTVTPENTITVLEAPREIYMGLENVVDYPMYGEADKDGDISFVCPFGMICFPVAGDVTINKIAIDTSYSNDEIDDNDIEISGLFQINNLGGNEYSTTFHSSTHNANQIVWSGTSSVTLTDTPVEFYGIMPAGEYGAGVEFQFTTTDGTTITKTTQQPFTVTRAQILNLPVLNVSSN